MYGQNPNFLAERFPTEVRATASGFCYRQGAIFGGLTAPIITYFAINWHLGFAIPMAIGTLAQLDPFYTARVLALGPETRGKQLTADLEIGVIAG